MISHSLTFYYFSQEQKIESVKDQNEKRHESGKDYVNKIKDMLESRVDQVMQFEDKIEQVNQDVNKLKGMTNDFQKKFIKELGQTNTENASIRT